MRHAVVLSVLVGLAACSHGSGKDTTPAAAATPKEVIAAGKATVEAWRQAWEVRSVETLGNLYVHDLDVVLVHDGAPLLGWTAIQKALEDRLGRAKEIHVRLKDVQVASIGPTVASAVATMTREISDGVTSVSETGALTIVMRKDDSGWKIVAEHYSSKRAS